MSKGVMCSIAVMMLWGGQSLASPLGTAFSYQGQLRIGGNPATGVFDLQFKLFDASINGTQVGETVCIDNFLVANGLFTVWLDFGPAAFDDQARWLLVSVKPGDSIGDCGSGSFADLSPRQLISATPFSLHTRGINVNAAGEVGIGGAPSASCGLTGYGNTGLVGRGTGQAGTGVVGIASASPNGSNFGLTGISDGTSGYGVYALATALTGTNYGLYAGTSSPTGYAGYFAGRGVFSGNLGLGVDSPTAKLHIGGTPGVDGIRFPDGTLQTTAGGAGGNLWVSNGNNVFNNNIGNVGIGVTMPDTKLHVNGTIRATALLLPAGAGQGRVLTSDDAGNATWQTPAGGGGGSLSLPYSGSANFAGGSVFGALNTSGTTGNGLVGSASGTSGVGVFGEATSASGGTTGVYGRTSSPSGIGVAGVSTATSGSSIAVSGSSSSADGFAVHGYNSASTGNAYAGYFDSNSTNGAAVFGIASNSGAGTSLGGKFVSNADLGVGVEATGRSYGLVSSGGWGVKATGTSSNGPAVYGETAGEFGAGLYGVATHATGPTTGTYGVSSSSNGIGVHGLANSPSGYTVGVLGESTSNTGIGVKARATGSNSDNFGVFAEATGTGSFAIVGVYGFSASSTGTGVWGSGATGVTGQATAPSGVAVYGSGRLVVTGTKSFQIDHPLDPENKYLTHYCTEAAEPLNAYSGNVTTDDHGMAWVELPAYFGAINKEYRYSLTVVDDNDSAEFVQAKVAREIRDNRFKIRTSAPQVKVSWRVEARRNDRYVAKYGATTEDEKPERFRGTYLQPELYGQPAERGQFHRPAQDSANPSEDSTRNVKSD